MSKPKILNDLGNTAQLNTTSKEVVGAVNEINSKLPTDAEKQAWNGKAEVDHEHTHLDMKSSNSSIRIGAFYPNHTGVYGGNGDNATIGTVTNGVSDGEANLILQSWYGVGFANSCPNAGAKGINIAMNVRTGSMEARGDVVASGSSLAKGLGYKGNYTGNIDELFSSGIYKLVNPFSGTMPKGQNANTVQHGIMLVSGDCGSGGSIVQELFTTNHSAYNNYANRQYKRIRFGGTWSNWTEVGRHRQAFTTDDVPSGTDLNEFRVAGRYYWTSSTTDVTNLPVGITSGYAVIENIGNSDTGEWMPQELTYRQSWSSTTRKWYRTYYGSNWKWSPWQEIGTLHKTPFNCTPSTGYTITQQNCYTLNGVAYFNMRISKSNFTVGAIENVVQIPVSLDKNLAVSLNSIGLVGTNWTGMCSAIISATGKYIILNVKDSNINQINISGTALLA